MDDVNVLVTFYSRTGSTERLAVWIEDVSTFRANA
jgi:hypothetical protein